MTTHASQNVQPAAAVHYLENDHEYSSYMTCRAVCSDLIDICDDAGYNGKTYEWTSGDPIPRFP